MAITDINISEELETNAPSIKYSGNEGPKSPQQIEQMMMAQLEEEYAKYVFEMQEQGLEPMSMQRFIEQAMAEGQMSKGPILPSDEDPINPFQPKPQGPVLPDRQMAAYGGIMGMDGRRQYGIGSSLKKAFRKIIPNEVAEIAVKAAPFVAPFNPLAAGLMSGIGSFDQTGRIGSSLKSGLMNYGLGNLARMAGGAGFQKGFKAPGTGTGFGSYFTSPTSGKQLFGQKIPGLDSNKELANKIANRAAENQAQATGLYTEGLTGAGDIGTNDFKKMLAEQMSEGSIGSNISKKQSTNLFSKAFTEIPSQVKNLLSKAGLGNNLVTGLLVGGLGAGALMGGMTEEEQAEMNRGEGMDVEGIRQEVLTAMKDPTGEALKAIRIKYPFLGRRDTKDLSQFAMGGRIRRAEGGLMDLGGMEKDYRAEGGFVPIGKKEKADDVPARLSVNEFVFTADAVRNAGGGDIDKGAEIMENMMKNLEAGGQVSEESQGMAGAQQMFETSERLSEVI